MLDCETYKTLHAESFCQGAGKGQGDKREGRNGYLDTGWIRVIAVLPDVLPSVCLSQPNKQKKGPQKKMLLSQTYSKETKSNAAPLLEPKITNSTRYDYKKKKKKKRGSDIYYGEPVLVGLVIWRRLVGRCRISKVVHNNRSSSGLLSTGNGIHLGFQAVNLITSLVAAFATQRAAA